MLITSLAVSLLIGQIPLEKIRSGELENGARYHIEYVPNSTQLVVSLVACSEGVEDTPQTHGYRHLLEHFMANGSTGTLNMKLESKGAAILASTTRDFTNYTIVSSPSDLNLALESLADVLIPVRTTPELIKKEAKIIGHEMSLFDMSRRASIFGWNKQFKTRPDTGGTVSILENATPKELQDLQAAHFQPSKLILVIAGPINLDAAKLSTIKFLGSIPKQKIAYGAPVKPENSVTPVGFTGQAKYLKVFGLPDRRTIALITVAYMLSARNQDLELLYSSSTRPGLITMYSTSGKGFEKLLDMELGHLNGANLFANLIIAPSENDAEQLVNQRSFALSWKPALNLEAAAKIASQLTLEEINSALQEWKSASVVRGDE